MEMGAKFKEVDTENIWSIKDNSDLCNVVAVACNNDTEQLWLLCLNPDCEDNDFNLIEIIDD